jgi:nitrogen regulatory protein PII
MMLIKSTIRSELLDDVQDALEALHVSGITVTDVRGFGGQKGQTAVYRGQEYDVSLRPRTEIEVIVPDDIVEEAVAALIAAARTGQMGDGQVSVLPVEETYRIRTRSIEI